MKFKVDTRRGGFESAVITGGLFEEAMAELTKRRYWIISISENADLRIRSGLGARICQKENYVREGAIYHKGERGIIVRESPYLENPELLRQAIQLASQAERFCPVPLFSTPDADLYEFYLKQVEEDSSKPPRERRAILMPPEKRSTEVNMDLEYLMFTTGQSMEDIRFSPEELEDKFNPDICDFLFGEFSNEYFEFVKTNMLGFKPVVQEDLKDISGTVVVQLRFEETGRYHCSNINGRCNFMERDVRGIKFI